MFMLNLFVFAPVFRPEPLYRPVGCAQLPAKQRMKAIKASIVAKEGFTPVVLGGVVRVGK
jgi:hypothetical protein